MPEEQIGTVDEYFAHIDVVGIALTAPLRIGDTVRIRGHTTDFQQVVESMQIEHAAVTEAPAGASVGVKVSERCRNGDSVFKVT